MFFQLQSLICSLKFFPAIEERITFSKTYDCLKTTKAEDSGVWIKFNNATRQKLKPLSKRKFWESDNGPLGDDTGDDDVEEPFDSETVLSSLIFFYAWIILQYFFIFYYIFFHENCIEEEFGDSRPGENFDDDCAGEEKGGEEEELSPHHKQPTGLFHCVLNSVNASFPLKHSRKIWEILGSVQFPLEFF